MKMHTLTIAELDAQSVEMLPAKETLYLDYGTNWAAVYASNSSIALNAASFLSHANSAALQSVTVIQSNH
ncbi:MAG TPA: hypothetical protein VIQ26_05340 [Microbacteriaceae bacterium]|jgi:hypothetical protein